MKQLPCLGALSALVFLAGCHKHETVQQPAHLVEQKPMEAAANVADIIIDDSDTNFHTEGAWQADEAGHDFKSGLHWAQGTSGQADARAIWTPDIQVGGTYNVYEWHGDDPNSDHATNAPFTINYDGGSKTAVVNLTENIGKWNLLGSFKFAVGTRGNVVLTNKSDGNVVADAIKLVYKSQ